MGKAVWVALKIFALLLGCSLVVLICGWIAISLRLGGYNWLILASFIILAAVVLALYSSIFHVFPFRRPPSKPFEFQPVDAGRTAVLHEMVKKDTGSLSLAQAKVLAVGVVNPHEIRRRMVERYVANRRTLDQSVAIDIKIARRILHEKETTPLYVPLLILPKGELCDDLQVFGDDGEPVTTVAYRDFVWIAARTVHLLLLTCYGKKKGEALPPEAEKAEITALSTIIMRQRSQENPHVDLSGVTAIDGLTVVDDSAKKLVMAFVQKLVTNYVIAACIDVPPTNRCRLSYQMTQIPELKLSARRSAKKWTIGGFGRLSLGVRPVELMIDVTNAGMCQSYHLHVQCPDDLYLAHQVPIGLDGMLSRRVDDAPSPPHCRFRRRLGQSHAHFYARYMPASRVGERPRIQLEFYEVPPGTTFRATVTAFSCAAIIWLIGFMVSRYGTPDTDAPAFLLAFPALAATWLGFEAPKQRLLEGTLSSRMCLIVTAALSLAASALFIAHKSAGDSFKWPLLWSANSALGVTHWDWAALVCLSILNALLIGYKCVMRTWQYSSLLVKRKSR